MPDASIGGKLRVDTGGCALGVTDAVGDGPGLLDPGGNGVNGYLHLRGLIQDAVRIPRGSIDNVSRVLIVVIVTESVIYAIVGPVGGFVAVAFGVNSFHGISIRSVSPRVPVAAAAHIVD